MLRSNWTILLKLSQKPLSLGQAAGVEKVQPKQLKFGKVEHELKHILLMEKCWVTSDNAEFPAPPTWDTQEKCAAYSLCSSSWVCVLWTASFMCKNVQSLLYTPRAAQLPAAQDSWLQISCITPLMSSWHIPPPTFFSAQRNSIVHAGFYLFSFF